MFKYRTYFKTRRRFGKYKRSPADNFSFRIFPTSVSYFIGRKKRRHTTNSLSEKRSEKEVMSLSRGMSGPSLSGGSLKHWFSTVHRNDWRKGKSPADGKALDCKWHGSLSIAGLWIRTITITMNKTRGQINSRNKKKGLRFFKMKFFQSNVFNWILNRLLECFLGSFILEEIGENCVKV